MFQVGSWRVLPFQWRLLTVAPVLSVPDVVLFPYQPSGSPGANDNIQGYLPPLRSPAAIASYISILCSIGSVVLGLMLVRQHRTKNRDFADEAVRILT